MNHLQLPVIITPSRAELGARCHRRHFLSDVLGKSRYYSASLEFGSVIHAGAAAHWLGQDVKGAIATEWDKRFTQNPDVTQKDVSIELANAMMDYYVENAKLAGPFTDQADFKRVDVEQRFEIPMGDQMLSFQCDRIAYDKEQNWLVVVDTKTAGRLNAYWERQWATSLQMKLYRLGVDKVFDLGGRIDIVIEGVLKHVPSEIRYIPCPEWSENMLHEAAYNAHCIGAMDQEIIEASCSTSLLSDAHGNPLVQKSTPQLSKAEELAVRLTPVNYADCFAYNVECPFYRICTADVDERVALLRGEYFESNEESY